MRRSSGKKRAPKTKMAKAMRKPMRKKTTKKGKNPWLLHVDNVLKELRKNDPNVTRKQAMIEAKKTYKKDQPVPEVEDSWNVSSSNYSTVSKKRGSAKKKKGKSRRRRRSRRRGGGGIPEGQCSGPQ